MPHDVFISYSSQDKHVADAVCAALEAADVRIRCWIAPRDVLGGKDFAEEIVNAISESRAMVLVFSANANTSSHIGSEVHLAFSKEKAIVPFRIEDVRPKGAMEYHLSKKHWIDALTPPRAVQIAKLVDTVASLLNRETRKPPERPPLETSEKSAQVSKFFKFAVPVAVLIGILLFLTRGNKQTGQPPKSTNDSTFLGNSQKKTGSLESGLASGSGDATASGQSELIKSANETLLKVFRNLNKTSHHVPYVVTIDPNTGDMTMDNGGARWEFNLGDLDQKSIQGQTWNPGAGYDHESTQIRADCLEKQGCVKWGHSNGFGEYKTPPNPTMVMEIQFEVYEGKGDTYGRNLGAEKDAFESLRILITHFRQQRR